MGEPVGLMAQEIKTTLMAGGLDLVTQPISMPPGKAISASNYEPDVAGYTSSGGFERFDGQPRPSEGIDQNDAEARRRLIRPVPGTGPVRGVWVYDGDIPEMPVDFHTVIKDAALCYLEAFDEGPRIPVYRLRMLPNWSMLESHQLPHVTWGSPLA